MKLIFQKILLYKESYETFTFEDERYCPHLEDRETDFESLMKEKNINELAMEGSKKKKLKSPVHFDD